MHSDGNNYGCWNMISTSKSILSLEPIHKELRACIYKLFHPVLRLVMPPAYHPTHHVKAITVLGRYMDYVPHAHE